MLPGGQEGVRSPVAVQAAVARLHRSASVRSAAASAAGAMCASEQTVSTAQATLAPDPAQFRLRHISSAAHASGIAVASEFPVARRNSSPPEEHLAVIAATHAHRQSPARLAARDRSAPHARRLRDGRSRIRRRAVYAGRAFEPRLFPDGKLHFTDHAGGHLVLARGWPGRKRRHVRHSARSRRRHLARACRGSRQRSRRCAWTPRASGAS